MLVAIKDINVAEDRFRKRFDPKALDLLQQSIAEVGQLSTIVVERDALGLYHLRAGARRLRAIKALHDAGVAIKHGDDALPLGHIAAVNYSDLTTIQRLQIEVEENVAREDFHWQEKLKAVAALHALRVAQNPGQTLTETASEIAGKPVGGGTVHALTEALILVKHLDDPDVAKAKTEKDAFKILSKKKEAEHRAMLAVTIDTKATPHTLLEGDSFALIKNIPDASIDVIVTDPPYGVDAGSFGSMAGTGHDYDDDPKVWAKVLAEMPDQWYRVCKANAAAYVFCDQRSFKDLALQMVLAGWKVFPTMLIWDKCGTGMLPYPEHGPRRTYEVFLYAWKGDRKTLKVGRDIFSVRPVQDIKHGAQKPVALYVEILNRSAQPGDRVLDNFGGTGPILVAANCLKLSAVYIEQNAASIAIAKGRINTAQIDDGGERVDGLEINLN